MLNQAVTDIITRLSGEPVAGTVEITGSGSSRNYVRIVTAGGKSYILCRSKNVTENRTFLLLTRLFIAHRLPVPEILWISKDVTEYLLEDVGRISLLDFIKVSKATGLEENPELARICFESMENLVNLQRLPEKEWREKVEFEPLGRSLVWYDFNYCITNFFEPSKIKYNSSKVCEELENLCAKLLSYPENLWGLMYRDFQSRNIMLKDGGTGNFKPYFIDYQSGRKGPGIYDLVSFAWQAKAGFSSDDREILARKYALELRSHVYYAENLIVEELPFWAMFRLMQVLGAYGLRGLKEGKQHFIESIPPALESFASLMSESKMNSKFPEIAGVINILNDKWKRKNAEG